MLGGLQCAGRKWRIAKFPQMVAPTRPVRLRRAAYRPDPDKVRSRLYRILTEMRASQEGVLEPNTVSLYRTIFPHMTGWLPEDEGAQLRFQFEEEMARLKAA